MILNAIMLIALLESRIENEKDKWTEEEQPTEWGSAKIYAIINARYEAYMPTIVTTNYGGAELVERMTPKGADRKNVEKTLDRLKEMCAGIQMNGKSRRSR